MNEAGRHYTKRYAERSSRRLYPVEFVVRTFFGSYPRLGLSHASYKGSRILDLWCGDGRNLELLADLGFATYAVEITGEICAMVEAHARGLGLDTVVRTGSNSRVPLTTGSSTSCWPATRCTT